MKKILFSILTISAIVSFNSCNEDRLDLVPKIDEIYTGQIKSEKEMLWATNNIYTTIGASGTFGADILIHADLMSDNTFVSNSLTSGYYQNIQNMGWSGETSFGSWRGLYNIIQKANYVILDKNLPETDVVKSFKGEAKIARGLAYFYLVQLYASTPTSAQYQEYGVPLVLEAYNPNFAPKRATVDENYNQIIKDLTEGINEMSETSRTQKIFLSPTAGRLLLSKVYLTRGKAGDFDKAIQYATETIEKAPGHFKLISKNQLNDYFTGSTEAKSENQPETIFEVEQSAKFSLEINAHPATFYSNTGNHKGIYIREWVFNQYDGADTEKDTSDDDSRIILTSKAGVSDMDSPTGVWTKKYPRSVGGNWLGNIKVFRMTEAKYIIMEAYARKGDQIKALELLNLHAIERNAKPYSGDALTAVLLDAQKEFIAEGHRFYDLKRNNLGYDKKTNCSTNNNSCNIANNSPYFVLPISLSERLLNPNMTQHPLWK